MSSSYWLSYGAKIPQIVIHLMPLHWKMQSSQQCPHQKYLVPIYFTEVKRISRTAQAQLIVKYHHQKRYAIKICGYIIYLHTTLNIPAWKLCLLAFLMLRVSKTELSMLVTIQNVFLHFIWHGVVHYMWKRVSICLPGSASLCPWTIPSVCATKTIHGHSHGSRHHRRDRRWWWHGMCLNIQKKYWPKNT